MILGSNNSLTYLEPLQWWLKIFKVFGKCQSLNYEDQYKYGGVRLFDIKVSVNDLSNHIIIKNGIYQYIPFSLYEILSFFNRQGDVVVMINLDETFEEYMSNRHEDIERKFKEYCKVIESIYENIMFCGGRRLFDGYTLYKFTWENKNDMPRLIYHEEQSRIYKFLSNRLPILSSIFNRKLIKKYENEHGYLMLNFIE